ncbi:hypothetical protein D8B23_15830 [Verminephrobacter aporrectodeae subsp. tuberculatae]|nr:hypothetical protein [Verminephrobacter aporrectodeae subsp. tuberculatae]
MKANAKIWLVADTGAARLSQDLAGDFTELFLLQVRISYPIRKLKESVRRREEEIAEARRLVSQVTDAKARNAGQEYVEELELVQQKDIRTIPPLHMEAFKATFGRFRSVRRTLAKLVSALREELSLPRDDDAFMEQLKDMEQQTWVMVHKAHGIDPPGPMPEIAEPGCPSGR